MPAWYGITQMLNRNCVSENALLHWAQPSATATILLVWSLWHKFSLEAVGSEGKSWDDGHLLHIGGAGAVWDELWDQHGSQNVAAKWFLWVSSTVRRDRLTLSYHICP